MRRFFATMFAVAILACCSASAEMFVHEGRCIDVPVYDEIEDSLVSLLNAAGLQNIVVYDSSDLTLDTIQNRRGTTIVERCIGLVTNKECGDGVILNYAELGNYIGYRDVYLPFENGSVILSYMVYDPDGTAGDDIMVRYDFLLRQ